MKTPARFYVHRSSMFDALPYDVDAMRARLRRNGLISRPAVSRAYGWRNQPEVLTFRMAKGVTEKQIADCLATLPSLQGLRPIIHAQDW